jgi:hypothetical protein
MGTSPLRPKARSRMPWVGAVDDEQHARSRDAAPVRAERVGGEPTEDQRCSPASPRARKYGRTGNSSPASESAMNTTWWRWSHPGGKPPTRWAIQNTG